MIYTPVSLLLLCTMILSTLMAIASTNWLMAWASMELNLLSFIPLILNSSSNQETEGAIKYFLAQALGSALMLFSSISMWHTHSPYMTTILTMSLLLKLGAAPCHFWFPQVMSSISWINCFIAATWQKFAPLFLLIFLTQPSHQLILLVCAMNSLIGGILGMNQSHLRTLLAYSSITHMGWTLSPMIIQCPNLASLYFIFYCMIVAPIFLCLAHPSVSNPNQFNLISKMNLLLISCLLLSLSGLPPFTGFLPKWILLKYLSFKYQTLILFLLLGSYLNLYFYLTVAFSSIMTPGNPKQTKLMNPSLLTVAATSCLGFIIMSYALTFFY